MASICQFAKMNTGGMRLMASTWRGALSFGLLTIPIRLYPAARSQRTYLHQLHDKCHTRLKQPLFCPTCNRIVSRDEVVKGYEYEEGHYVLVDNEDMKKITPKSGKTMEILAFVKQEQIDPIYFDASYFALPDKDADKAYQVLLKALEDTGRVGIAQVTMHQRDYTVFIRPRDHGITVHTMYFQNEIREVSGYGEKPGNLTHETARDQAGGTAHRDFIGGLQTGAVSREHSRSGYARWSSPSKRARRLPSSLRHARLKSSI